MKSVNQLRFTTHINFDKTKLIERVIIMLYLINTILKWRSSSNDFTYTALEVPDVYASNQTKKKQATLGSRSVLSVLNYISINRYFFCLRLPMPNIVKLRSFYKERQLFYKKIMTSHPPRTLLSRSKIFRLPSGLTFFRPLL